MGQYLGFAYLLDVLTARMAVKVAFVLIVWSVRQMLRNGRRSYRHCVIITRVWRRRCRRVLAMWMSGVDSCTCTRMRTVDSDLRSYSFTHLNFLRVASMQVTSNDGTCMSSWLLTCHSVCHSLWSLCFCLWFTVCLYDMFLTGADCGEFNSSRVCPSAATRRDRR